MTIERDALALLDDEQRERDCDLCEGTGTMDLGYMASSYDNDENFEYEYFASWPEDCPKCGATGKLNLLSYG